jgi:hypothetical protein
MKAWHTETLSDTLGAIIGNDDDREVTLHFVMDTDTITPDSGPDYFESTAALERAVIGIGLPVGQMEIWGFSMCAAKFGAKWVEDAEGRAALEYDRDY